jgi:hypothetical protein
MIVLTAFAANKRLFFLNQLMIFAVLTAFSIFDSVVLPSRFLLVNEFKKHIRTSFTVFPDPTQFQNRTKSWSFQFVDVMIYFVWTVHKFRYCVINCDLDLTVDNAVEFCNDHDIICGVSEPVLNFNDFELFRIFIGNPLNFFKNAENLFFLWRIFAPH